MSRIWKRAKTRLAHFSLCSDFRIGRRGLRPSFPVRQWSSGRSFQRGKWRRLAEERDSEPRRGRADVKKSETRHSEVLSGKNDQKKEKLKNKEATPVFTMDGGLTVTFISVAMFVGTFLLGFFPLLFKLSQKSLQLVSVLGAGLLCGTALAITIPEGVDLLEESLKASSRPPSSDVPPVLNETNATSTEGQGSPSRLYIGIALTFGFTFMFVVDQIGEYFSTRDQSGQRQSNSSHITATLGLVIHAAADGFALGAAVATGEVSVQVIVFLAVILHKAPAAFGLVSFLMHTGLEKKHIQGHLLAFSAAAPLVAISTYFILHATDNSAHSHLLATGVGMLFSAGTFLYVATVHVLPEVQQQDGMETVQKRRLGLLESFTLVLGVGLPVLLALGLQDD